MIQVYYTCLPGKLTEAAYYNYLCKLPKELQERNARFRNWSDRWLNLLGKLLLIEALEPFGYSAHCLDKLHYNDNGRPSISNDIDFNISHSGKYVMCAVGRHIRLGIDIEEIKQIDVKDFENVMTGAQWKDIFNSEDLYRSFFSYWTIKESVIKADSRGLSIPLDSIHVYGDEAICDSRTWYLTDLCIDQNYCTSLAANEKNIEVNILFKDFQ
jgi:4'-phosphopantetheinyl transferase